MSLTVADLVQLAAALAVLVAALGKAVSKVIRAWRART